MIGFSTPPPAIETPKLDLDPYLMSAIIAGTQRGLSMTHAKIDPVGASRLVTARHELTVMVGMVGNHSGNVAMNLSTAATLHLAAGLLGDPQTELTEDAIDAVMELGNMVGGAIKNALAETPYVIAHISLPSLIMGPNSAMIYARGIQTVSVEFELHELPVAKLNARFFSITVSLLRGSGVKSW